MAEIHQSSERDCLLQGLFSINYRAKHDDIFRRRTENTGMWFLEHPSFVEWRNGTLAKPLLFCHGIAGSGKTMIASIVIENLIAKYDELTTTAYVYCDKQEKRGQTAVELINSLLYQLLTETDGENEALYNAILPMYKSHMHGQPTTSPSEQEFSDIFRKALEEFNTVFIVIDALDNVPKLERATFIQVIKNLAALGARVLVTSREFVEIEKQFADDSLYQWLEISATEEDVRTYLKAEINRRPKLKSLTTRDPALHQKISDEIIGKSKGMFLIAQCYLEAVMKERTMSCILSALQGLPVGVEAIYEDIMNQIEQQEGRDVNVAKTVLTWVTYAFRPITIKELQHALLINDGVMELDQAPQTDVRYFCAGLVRLNRESGTITLAHYTVHEYLRGRGQHFLPVPHEKIAATCLEYLSWHQFPYPSDQHGHLRFIEGYAVENWGHHIKKGSVNTISDKALRFLSQKQNVVRAYNAMQGSHIIQMRNFDTDDIPIALATFFGLGEIVESLLGGGLEVDKKFRLLVRLIHVAKRRGYSDLMGSLLDKLIDICAKGNYGWDVLTHERDKGDIISLLLENGANVEKKDILGRTLLHYASTEGYESIVRLLLVKGANIEAKDNNSSTALHTASANNKKAVVQLLLEKRADIDAKDNNGWTALHSALVNGHEAVARLLLKRCASIESKGNDGWRALHRASANGNKAVVRLLLERHADIEAQDNDGWTALHRASANNQEAVVQLLLEKDADFEAKDNDGWTALHRASANNHEAVVRLLLEEGADIDAKDKNSWTALHSASENGHEAIVRLLIEKHVNIEAKDNDGWTALHRASANGREAVVRLLLEQGADIEAKDSDYSTALHRASANGREQVVRLLLEKGANLEASAPQHRKSLFGSWFTSIPAKDNDWGSALHKASSNDHEAIVRLLLEKGAGIEARDNNYSTALHRASAKGHKEVVQLLLEKGANLDAKDNCGKKPLSHALKNDHEAVVKFLLSKGTK